MQSIKDLIAILLLAAAVIFGVWLVSKQIPRLSAYDDCYMAKYEDWSTDCELGGYK